MYYADEVRKPDEVKIKGELRAAEVEMAKSLVENLSEPFDPEKYDDTYRKELLELMRAKAKGRKLPEPAEEEEGEVVDLMAALRESVERTSQRGDGKTTAGRPAKRKNEQEDRPQGKLRACREARRVPEEARPTKTPEPFGAKKGTSKELVMQRHDASWLTTTSAWRWNGALASWAVPKGSRSSPGSCTSRYTSMTIRSSTRPSKGDSKGEYGEGIWSRSGTTERTSCSREKRNGGLTVRLHGERLDGVGALVPARSTREKNWLIMQARR